ncbi:putative chloramphenical resistance permease RarD [Neisseria animaloris]|nr:putative chloramphenical resistance permease RarD [Neisseria animaloris]
MSEIRKGVLAALLSNILFGVLYLYGRWMEPMGGTEVFAWRIVSMLFILWLTLLTTRTLHSVFTYIKKIGKNRKQWAYIILPTPILASQLWLFMWGPVNGYGVDIAMGYFLFPLMMVLCGRIFLAEYVNRLQWLAVGLAALGVAHELWQTHAFFLGYFMGSGHLPDLLSSPPYNACARTGRIVDRLNLDFSHCRYLPFVATAQFANFGGTV